MKNALAAYDRFNTWKPEAEKDLLEAHRIQMSGRQWLALHGDG